MKAKIPFLILVLTCLPLTAPAADNGNLNGRITDARDVIRQIMMTPDKCIPNSIARQATCIGVIPNVKKQPPS